MIIRQKRNDGEYTELLASTAGALNVTLADRIAGEDFDSNTLKIEERCTYYPHTGSVIGTGVGQVTVLSGGGGRFHGLFVSRISTASPTTSRITVYDDTTTTNVLLNTFTPSVGLMRFPPVLLQTGLTLKAVSTSTTMTVLYSPATSV